ncbi:hypothetical protein FRC09_000707 [Ceratobasidium sp. 395]|nr:hypothetical protein FRC09_000707 [Ceratobasidium sp. 395]
MNAPAFVSKEEQPTRFDQVLRAIARTKNILVLCGDSATADAGIPPLDASVDYMIGSEPRRRPLRDLIQECSPRKVSADNLSVRMLVGLNRAMAARRAAARLAPRSRFQELLAVLNEKEKLVQCLTTAVDGLEAGQDERIDRKTTRLFGDNRRLLCLAKACKSLDPMETATLDEKLMSAPSGSATGNDFGPVCKDCKQKCELRLQPHLWLPMTVLLDTKTARDKRKFGEKTLLLRPAVQLELSSEAQAGDVNLQIMAYARQSQLLLITGETLRNPGVRELCKQLAVTLRGHGGAVVYVSPEPLRGRNAFDFIDIHLGLNSIELARLLTEAILKPGSSDSLDDAALLDCKDIWVEISRNQLPPVAVPEDELYSGAACERCQCSVEEYLVTCRACRSQFCARRIGYDESDLAPVNEDGTIRPTSLPGDDVLEPAEKGSDEAAPKEKDTFPLESGCVIFNHYSADGSRPPLAQARREFTCFDCWNHREHGRYPHFIRPIPHLRSEPAGERFPRIAVVLYYVEEFWPQAQHFVGIMRGRWSTKGWACMIEPVKLEHMSEQPVLFPTMTWEPLTYSLFVVYLTHGLTEDLGYQLAHEKSMKPARFLEHTLGLARPAIENARDRRCFMWCCGHPLYHSGLVADLVGWLKGEGLFDSFMAAMNVKLSPAFLLVLTARLSTALVDPDPQAMETAFRQWLTDIMAPSHTNLFVWSRDCEPRLWLYAPFQSRPLGKPLPSVIGTCTCPDLPDGPQLPLRRQNSRKTWEVDHNGRDGMKLRDVVAKATCTVCRQVWPLPADHLTGELRKFEGIFAAVVPYFVAEE